MSNLSDLLPAGAGGKQVSFTASGAISSGQTVALNSDGTVEAISGTTASDYTGSNTTFTSNELDDRYSACGFDPVSGKFLIVYLDKSNSYYVTGVVATISGTSVSFGTPSVINSASSITPEIVYDENAQKLVVAYASGTSLNVRTATISGTSASYGTAATVSNAPIWWVKGAYSTSAQKIVFSGADNYNGDGKTVVATVSGTTVTLGTPNTYETGTVQYGGICYDPNEDKFIIGYTKTNLGSGYGVSVVGTLSGTSVSFGSQQTFNAAVTNYIALSYDLSQSKVLFAYKDAGNSGYTTVLVASVSGSTLSFGSDVTLVNQATSESIASVYDPNTESCLVTSGWGSGGIIHQVSISGTTASSVGSKGIGARTQGNSIAIDTSTGNSLVAFRNSSASDVGQAKPFRFGYTLTNSANFIGIADEAISDTASGNITIKGGISTNVTGLTPNSTYYVQSDGTLSTTSSSVIAGKALSATSINLDYSS